MAVITHTQIAQTTFSNTGSATHSLTVGTTLPVGAMAVMYIYDGGQTSFISANVVDSQGNTWGRDQQIALPSAGVAPDFAKYSSRLTAALGPTDTITYTSPVTTSYGFMSLSLLRGGMFYGDGASVNRFGSGAVSLNTSANLAGDGEYMLAAGVFASSSSSAVFQPDTGDGWVPPTGTSDILTFHDVANSLWITFGSGGQLNSGHGQIAFAPTCSQTYTYSGAITHSVKTINTGAGVNINSGSGTIFTSGTLNNSTQPNGQLIIAQIDIVSATARTVSTVTGGGLTWTKRGALSDTTTFPGFTHRFEVWYATTSGQYNDTIIVTLTGALDGVSPGVYAAINSFLGINTSTPFDSDPSFPQFAYQSSASAGQTVTTQNAVDAIIGSGTFSGGVFTKTQLAGGGGAVGKAVLSSQYTIVGSAQSASAIIEYGGTKTNWIWYADALKSSLVIGTAAPSIGPITQAVAAKETEKAAIAQTLFAPTQAVAGTVRPTGTIAQTLLAPTQAVTVVEHEPVTIATTLLAPTQAVTVVEHEPVTIATTLLAPTQAVTVFEHESRHDCDHAPSADASHDCSRARARSRLQ
jgi:hypothetical protein